MFPYGVRCRSLAFPKCEAAREKGVEISVGVASKLRCPADGERSVYRWVFSSGAETGNSGKVKLA